MTRNDYLLAALLGFAYVALIGFLTGMTVTWGDFISEDDFWGQSNAHAVAYMQLYHSIGVVLAALPICLAIVWRFSSAWFRPTMIAAIIGGSYMLFDQLRGVWYLSQQDIVPTVHHVVSGTIDVVKVALILVVITAVLIRAFAPDRAPA